MNSKTYGELLAGKFRVLGNYVDRAMHAGSEREALFIIASKILPFIRNSKSCRRFMFQRIADRDNYYRELNKCMAVAPKQVERTFESLKLDLRDANLLSNEQIERHIVDIEKVFNNIASFRMPTYIEVVDEKIATLLHVILELNHHDIVRSYATIENQFVERVNVQKNKLERVEKPYISEITYAPSLNRLQELRNLFCSDSVEDIWIAWEFLALLEWCWNTPFSFFENKELHYDDYQSASYSNQLLQLHSVWCVVNQIKNKEIIGSMRSMFCREYFKKYLELIMDYFVDEQEEVQDQQTLIKDSGSSKSLIPYSIELKLVGLELLLDVEWFDYGGAHSCILQTYRSESGPFNCMDLLLNKEPVGTMLNIEKIGFDGMNTGKLITSKKNAIAVRFLMKLFFQKDTNDRTRKISLKSKVILCSDLSKHDQQELVQHLLKMAETPMINAAIPFNCKQNRPVVEQS